MRLAALGATALLVTSLMFDRYAADQIISVLDRRGSVEQEIEVEREAILLRRAGERSSNQLPTGSRSPKLPAPPQVPELVPSEESGGLCFQIRWGRGGDPARNLRIVGLPPLAGESRSGRERLFTIYTDGSGFAGIDGLAPGPIRVVLGEDEVFGAHVIAGETTLVEYTCETRPALVLLVMTESRQRIEGAQIFGSRLSGRLNSIYPLGESDLNGRLVVCRPHRYQSISASYPGLVARDPHLWVPEKIDEDRAVPLIMTKPDIELLIRPSMNGEPIDEARVHARDAERGEPFGGVIITATEDLEAAVKVIPAQAGSTLEVVASVEGSAFGRVIIDTRSLSADVIDLECLPWIEISGSVTGLRGAAGAKVRLDGDWSIPDQTVHLDGESEFKMRAPQRDVYRLCLLVDGLAPRIYSYYSAPIGVTLSAN